MTLKTIWTIPAMDFSERVRRNADLRAMKIAVHLPARVAYWSFIHQGVRNIKDNEVVPEVTYTEVLGRLRY